MMISQINREQERKRIHERVRRKISGTEARPRLCVFRSLNHIYTQVVDDSKSVTVAAASSRDADLRGQLQGGGSVVAAKLVGKTIAERARSKGVERVVFDRGGYLYHGRVKALAEAAREAGLKF